MLLNFKDQFVRFVEDGSKCHTLRAKRKSRPKAGEVCHCYTGLRRKGPRLLGRFECTRVQDVKIWITERGHLYIEIDGVQLTTAEIDSFAYTDGFRNSERSSTSQMLAFWVETNNLMPGENWHGDLIHWRYKPGTNKGFCRDD